MDNDLEKTYRENLSQLEKLRNNLEEITINLFKDYEHIDRISFRVKSVTSFIKKASDIDIKEPYNYPLNEIEDQVAGRIIVFFLEDLEVIREQLLTEFTRVEFSERRTPHDKNFGYESDHFIFTIPPHAKPKNWDESNTLPSTFEIQVRTIFQHAYAEPQHNIGYKSLINLPPDKQKELAWIAASAWGADHALSRIYQWYIDNQN